MTERIKCLQCGSAQIRRTFLGGTGGGISLIIVSFLIMGWCYGVVYERGGTSDLIGIPLCLVCFFGGFWAFRSAPHKCVHCGEPYFGKAMDLQRLIRRKRALAESTAIGFLTFLLFCWLGTFPIIWISDWLDGFSSSAIGVLPWCGLLISCVVAVDAFRSAYARRKSCITDASCSQCKKLLRDESELANDGICPSCLEQEGLRWIRAEIDRMEQLDVFPKLDPGRYCAVKRLVQTGWKAHSSPDNADLLRHMLAMAYRDGRKQAAQELAGMGESHWKDLVKGGSSDFVRIAKSDDSRALEILVAGLYSGNMDVLPAIARFGYAGTDHLLAALKASLDKWDRCQILRALGPELTERGFGILSDILMKTSADEDVKVAAAAALDQSADPRVALLFVQVAKDQAQPYSVRKKAGDALAARGTPVPLRFKREDWDISAYVHAILQCASEGNTEEGTAQIYRQRVLLREYGEEINHKSGFIGMQQVCQTIRDQLGPGGPARALESVWSGIGEWRG